MSIADNKQDFLYKKNLGVVASQGSNVSYQSETAGNARSRIISNLQLFSQPIPQNAPKLEDLGPKKYVKADGSLETDNKDNGLGTVQTSNTYPYIQYVDSLKLSTASKYAYYFNNPGVSTNTNLLSNAVPYNYNPSNTSWSYKVTSSKYNGNVDPSLYIVDTDAGYLYFANTTDWDSSNGTPSISFYRYNGTMGIPTNLGNFAGAYSQGTGAIAYGDRAGVTGQGVNAIAMGNLAGAYGQGTGSIAIGYLAGPTGMSANSIVLNASGTALYGTGPTGGFYVAPIASYSGSMGPFTLLAYGADKQIVGITGDALTALGIVGGGGGGGGSANYNIGNNVILSGTDSTVPTPRHPDNDDGGFYVSPVLGYTGSSSTTFNVLGHGSNDKEVITLPITLETKNVLIPLTINNNLQLPMLVPGNLTYINNSGLLVSTDVTMTQLANMSGVNPTNSVAIGNGAGADVSGLSNGTYTKWLTSSVVANDDITGVAMSASGQIQLYGLDLVSKQWANSTTTYYVGDILHNQSQNNYYYVTGNGTISSAPSGTSDSDLYSYINLYTLNLNLKNDQYVSYQNTVYKITVTGVTLGGIPSVGYDTTTYYGYPTPDPPWISGDVKLGWNGDTNAIRRPNQRLTISRGLNYDGYYTLTVTNLETFTYNGIVHLENMYIPDASNIKYILHLSFVEGISKNAVAVYNTYTFTINSNSYTLTNPPSLQNPIGGVSFTQIGFLPTSTSPNIYKSVDRGATFLPIPLSIFPNIPSNYNFVVSGDGTCIIAFRYKNFYISTNSGVTHRTFPQAPLSFAINTDGSYIMLVSTGGIYVTNKTNLNFESSKATITASSASCAMTPDGKYMRAIINGSQVYTSIDYGTLTFTQVAPSSLSLPTSNLSLIAISGTGSYQLVSTTNTLYVSANTGGTFASKLSNTNLSITIISSIAVSRTGQYMIACCSSSSVKGYVYYSTNFGENWQIMTALGFDFFNSCAISADGTLFTVSTPSNVYTLDNNLIGNTVAIGNGAGQSNQPANTIAINASGTPLNPSTSNGCYIAPIADVSNSTSTFFNLLGYGSDNQVVKSNVFINSNGNSIINNYNPTKEDIGYFLKAGNASFYIGDDYSSLPTGSGTTYGRYFGTDGNIYQDFSGSFFWRRVTNASNVLYTSSNCMTLDNNGNLTTTGGITSGGIITASHIISTGIGTKAGEALNLATAGGAGIINLITNSVSRAYVDTTGLFIASNLGLTIGVLGSTTSYLDINSNLAQPMRFLNSTGVYITNIGQDAVGGVFRIGVPGGNGVLLTYNNNVWGAYSDARLKENVAPITGLDKILQLKPVSYNMITTPNRINFGFLAQDVLPIIPEIVEEVYYKDDEKRYMMTPSEILPFAVKAIQEQQTQIDDMKKELDELKQQTQIDELKQQLVELKLLLNSMINKPL